MRTISVGVLAILCAAAPALAESGSDAPSGQLWIVGLEGCQRAPAVATSASGRAVVELTYASSLVTYSLTLADVATTVTAVHLHGPAARGADGPIVMALPTAAPIAGSFTASPEVRTQLQNGRLYFDVHTTAFPDGELRGQVDDLGSACPPPVDAGLPDGPTPDGTVAGLDAAGSDDGKPEGCDGCAAPGAPALAPVAAVGALLARRRRRPRR